MLIEIKQIMMAETCECNLILSDMNSHLTRQPQPQFTSIIELGFVIFWDNPDITEGIQYKLLIIHFYRIQLMDVINLR